MSKVLVVDTGSRSIRASIVRDGTVLGTVHRGCEPFAPEAAPTGREWDPTELWNLTCDAMGQAAAIAQPDAVVCTAQRLATVFLDVDGRTLYAGSNADARGFVESIEIGKRQGIESYDVCGHFPPIVLAPARVAWFRNNAPDVAEAIHTILPLCDWYGYRLTGVLGAEPSAAGATGLLSVAERTWARDFAAEAGVDPDVLPELRSPGDLLGHVTAGAAAQTGLPEGLPVAVGCGDTMGALLGMGVVNPAETGIVAGSTMPVMRVDDRPVLDPKRRCWAHCHAIDGRWLVEANGSEAGIAQRWLADLMAVAPEDLHSIAEDRPAALAPPLVLGPGPMDFSNLPMNRAGEIRVNLPLGVLGTSREDLARSWVENLAYGARACVDWLREIAPVGPLSLGGGMAESNVFPTVLASVMQEPVRCHDIDVTARGTALCAEVALGTAPDLATASAALAETGHVVEPLPDWTDAYAGGYEQWSAAQARLFEGVVGFTTLLA